MAQEIKTVADLLLSRRPNDTYGAFTESRGNNFFYRLNVGRDSLSAESSCQHITLDPLMVIIFEGNAVENLQQLATSLNVTGKDPLDTLKSIMRRTTKKDVPHTETNTFSIMNFIIVTGIDYEYYAETFRCIYQFPKCPDFLKDKSSQTYINSEATKRLVKAYLHGNDEDFFISPDWIPLGLMDKDLLEKENSPTAYYDIVYLSQFKVTERSVSCFGVTVTMPQLFRYVWRLCLGDNDFDVEGYRTKSMQYQEATREEYRYSTLRGMHYYFAMSALVTKTQVQPLTIEAIEAVLLDGRKNAGMRPDVYPDGILVDEGIFRGEENRLLEDMLTRLLRGYFINHLPFLLDLTLRLYDCVHTHYKNARTPLVYVEVTPEKDELDTLRALLDSMNSGTTIPVTSGTTIPVTSGTTIPVTSGTTIPRTVGWSNSSLPAEARPVSEEDFFAAKLREGQQVTSGSQALKPSGEKRPAVRDPVDGFLNAPVQYDNNVKGDVSSSDAVFSVEEGSDDEFSYLD